MKVKLLKDIKMAKDGISITQYSVGDIVDVSDKNATSLIEQKKCERYHVKVIEDFVTKAAQKESTTKKTKAKKKK